MTGGRRPAPSLHVTTGKTGGAVSGIDGAAGPADASGYLSLLAAASGVAIAVQSRVNGALRARIGDAVVAALVSFAFGLFLLVTAALVTGRWRTAARLRSGTRWWWWLGGLAGALLVASTAAAGPAVGVALTSVAIVAGATAGSLVVDRLGISPRGRQSLTASRLAGSGLAVAGLVVGAAARAAVPLSRSWRCFARTGAQSSPRS